MSWMFEMGRIKRVHFVGIGGAGMAGIAEVLLRQGYIVSGSDLSENALVQWLRVLGATIERQHIANNVHGADVIVRSSAIDWNNPELQEARSLRIPIVPRAEMLGELMRFRYGIAISGTHGKTTTTSLVTSILAEADLDPTFVIGGRLNSAGSHARLGKGRYLVAEADESDASFLHLKPMISIITNIDQDHMATYNNDFEQLKNAFVEFIHRLPFYGLAVLCIDDLTVREMLPRLSRPILTYGLDPSADFKTLDYKQCGTKTQFIVDRPNGLSSLEVSLNLPGRHNVLNALAAIAVASELKIPDKAIITALQNFAGIGRRFQIYGDLLLPNGGKALLIDDYGHHPREIAATLQAARESWPHRRLVMVYQPHRYTRTRDLFDDFCTILAKPDQLLLLEIYSAGEDPISGINSQALIQAIQQNLEKNTTIFIEDHQNLSKNLQMLLRDGDILLMQGAGNIGTLAAQLAATGLLGEKQKAFI